MKILSCSPGESPQIEDVEFNADFLHQRLGFSFLMKGFTDNFILYTRTNIEDDFNCMIGNRAVYGKFFLVRIDRSVTPPKEADLSEEDISTLTMLVTVSRNSAQAAEA